MGVNGKVRRVFDGVGKVLYIAHVLYSAGHLPGLALVSRWALAVHPSALDTEETGVEE